MFTFRNLHEKMKEDAFGKPCGFINPGVVSKANTTKPDHTRQSRAQHICDRMLKSNKGQLILMPYNPW